MQQIEVWAPGLEVDGPWSVSHPASAANGQTFDQVGPALARQGVVFATDFRVSGARNRSRRI